MTDLATEFAGLANAFAYALAKKQFQFDTTNWSVNVYDITDHEVYQQIAYESRDTLPEDFDCIGYLDETFVVTIRVVADAPRDWYRVDRMLDDKNEVCLMVHRFCLEHVGWVTSKFVSYTYSGKPHHAGRCRLMMTPENLLMVAENPEWKSLLENKDESNSV
jgi:hypothetical protein